MNNTLKKTIQILFISQVFSLIVQAQVPRPDKAYGVFSTMVEEVVTLGVLYKYSYNLTNSEMSEQVLECATIFVSDNSFYKQRENVTVISDKEWFFDGLITKGAVSGCAASNTLDIPPPDGLTPGDTIAIQFNSTGLPAIHPFYTRGHIPPMTETRLEELLNQGLSMNEIFIDWREEEYKGFTVSPKVWSENINFELFQDSLESYRQRSCEELNWANDAVVCGELEVQLSKIKSFISTGDSLSAANTLQEFIELVESEKENSLTSEGYALLYFNGKYLWNRLLAGKD